MEKDNLTDVSAPELEDENYIESRRATASLDDIAVPELEDTYVPPTSTQKQSLDDITAPVLEDTYKPSENADNKLDGVTAPVLEDTYVPPKKNDNNKKDLEEVKAALLEEEEVPVHKPQYVDPNIEKVKKEALQRSIQASLNEKPASIDEKRSREMYFELMEEQKDDLARKGGKITIVLMILGIIMSAVFFVFSNITPFKSDSVGVEKVADIISTCCYISGGLSLFLIVRSKAIKSLASLVFGLMTLISLAGGGYMLVAKSDFVLNFILLLVAIIINIFISFTLTSNEAVELYYKRKKAYN